MSISYNFSIKHITTLDRDFVDALKIYANTTPPVIMTNTNDLTAWLSYSDEDCFIPMQFVLKLDNVVIGYAFICYIKLTKIAIIDYIALQPSFRLNTIFLAFLNLLQSYVREQHTCTYFIVEISNKSNGNEIDKESLLFKKLLCLEGFCKVNYKYETPPFGINTPETTFDAFLYIQSNDVIYSILIDTFLQLVQSIYEYYFQWFSKVSNNEKFEYKKLLDQWFDRIKERNTETECKVVPIDCPLLNEAGEITYGYIPTTKFNSKKILLILALILLILPMPITVTYNAILNNFNIPIREVNTLIGSFLAAGITAITGLITHSISNKKS